MGYTFANKSSFSQHVRVFLVGFGCKNDSKNKLQCQKVPHQSKPAWTLTLWATQECCAFLSSDNNLRLLAHQTENWAHAHQFNSCNDSLSNEIMIKLWLHSRKGHFAVWGRVLIYILKKAFCKRIIHQHNIKPHLNFYATIDLYVDGLIFWSQQHDDLQRLSVRALLHICLQLYWCLHFWKNAEKVPLDALSMDTTWWNAL